MKTRLSFLRTVLLSIGIIVFLLFSGPFIGGIRNIGTAVGSLLALIFVACVLFFEKIAENIKKIGESKRGRLLISIFIAVIALVLILAIWMTVLMCSYSREEAPENACVVILGCQVKGTEPSRMLRQRLETAIVYLEDHPGCPCIVSGGRGTDENLSEAECMRMWLAERGIDQNRIYVEDRSRNTRENLSDSLKIIEINNLSRDIVIVTNEFHQYRASRFASDNGLTAYSLPVSTDLYLLPGFWLREMMAIFGECTLGIN